MEMRLLHSSVILLFCRIRKGEYMNVCGVFYTTSMKDELARGPIHGFIQTADGEITLCGKKISGPMWYYTYDSPTCKMCEKAKNKVNNSP